MLTNVNGLKRLLGMWSLGMLLVFTAAVDTGGAQGAIGPVTRDSAIRALASGTAVLRGSVKDLSDGSPIENARITVTALDAPSGRTAVTDLQGGFSVVGLPAGRFTVSAQKPGYVGMAFGARRPGTLGTQIQLRIGEVIEAVDIGLPRGAVVSGVIAEPNGRPATGVRVRVLRYSTTTGGPVWQEAATSTTDDRGRYRAYGLRPGRYLPVVVPPQGQIPGGKPETLTAFSAVFYPGVTYPRAADAVEVEAGQEREDLNVRLEFIPTRGVEGDLSIGGVVIPENVSVALVSKEAVQLPSSLGYKMSTASVDAAGHFMFRNVAPGNYSVQARGSKPIGPRGSTEREPGPIEYWWANGDVTVDGADSSVALILQPGVTLSGRMTFVGGEPPSDMSRSRVALSPRGQQVMEIAGIQLAKVAANGQFTFVGVPPGRYTFTATLNSGTSTTANTKDGDAAARSAQTNARSWTLSSATLAGQEILDEPLDIGSQSVGNVVMTFVRQEQMLAGRILTTDGRGETNVTIVVFPTESKWRLPQARRIKIARPANDGSYMIRGLPPGSYRLSAVTDVENGQWFDPEFLNELLPSSVAVTLTPGEHKVQDVKVMSAR